MLIIFYNLSLTALILVACFGLGILQISIWLSLRGPISEDEQPPAGLLEQLRIWRQLGISLRGSTTRQDSEMDWAYSTSSWAN